MFLTHERTAKAIVDFLGKGNCKIMEKLVTKSTQMIPVPRAVTAIILQGEKISMFTFALVSLILTRKTVRMAQDDANFNGLPNFTVIFFTIGTNLGTVNTKMITHMIEISRVTALFPLASLT